VIKEDPKVAIHGRVPFQHARKSLLHQCAVELPGVGNTESDRDALGSELDVFESDVAERPGRQSKTIEGLCRGHDMPSSGHESLQGARFDMSVGIEDERDERRPLAGVGKESRIALPNRLGQHRCIRSVLVLGRRLA
jgi:hypothetical protein